VDVGRAKREGARGARDTSSSFDGLRLERCHRARESLDYGECPRPSWVAWQELDVDDDDIFQSSDSRIGLSVSTHAHARCRPMISAQIHVGWNRDDLDWTPLGFSDAVDIKNGLLSNTWAAHPVPPVCSCLGSYVQCRLRYVINAVRVDPLTYWL